MCSSYSLASSYSLDFPGGWCVCVGSLHLWPGLCAGSLIQQMDFPGGETVLMCSLVDPYVLLATGGGAVYLLQLNTGSVEGQLIRQTLTLKGVSLPYCTLWSYLAC